MSDFTTMQRLIINQSPQHGFTFRDGDHVIHIDYAWDIGHYCEIYEFVDDPDDYVEDCARLNLIAQKDSFACTAESLKWGFEAK